MTCFCWTWGGGDTYSQLKVLLSANRFASLPCFVSLSLSLANIPLTPETARDQERRIRREIANSNERRRMQSINAGFQSLKTLIPHSDGEKLSKVGHKLGVCIRGGVWSKGPCRSIYSPLTFSHFGFCAIKLNNEVHREIWGKRFLVTNCFPIKILFSGVLFFYLVPYIKTWRFSCVTMA